MRYINEEGALIIQSWCQEPEKGALEQARHLARLPFAFRKICLMPDTHQGYGMPIGGVLATEGVIVPFAVGVDIGCGMCAVQTNFNEIDKPVLKRIMGEIRQAIPVGFEHHKEAQDDTLMPIYLGDHPERTPILDREYTKALTQIGTLGGGNHFIEIQKGDDGFIWIMVHSGSRNIGLQVAAHYNRNAVELNEKYFSSVPREWDLAFLPLQSEEGFRYMSEMNYCVDFALANRQLMIERIKEIFKTFTTGLCTFGKTINIAHNYARMENHFGKNVMVHRKGATSARLEEIGIIPGSQGSPSYVVSGLGNSESFKSCSHGAGRRMGRKEARNTLNLAEEQKKLDDQGTIHSVRNIEDLDEAPGSYKDIDTVMKEQEDLVKIIVKLKPLATIKG